MTEDILVVGGGGREHALCLALRRCGGVGKLWCAPGNAGIAGVEDCERVGVSATDIGGLVALALEKNVGLVVVGQDDPLSLGLVDALNDAGVRAFGPTRSAARLEASKAFAKNLMRKHGIPTAGYAAFDALDAALDYARGLDGKIVVKADGLSLGKGVIVCDDVSAAEVALTDIMAGGRFGAAGDTVVIEEFLEGREVTVMAFCDGFNVAPMVAARDHKRAFDGDMGLNTGGMGVIAPVPDFTREMADWCGEHIFRPTVAALNAEGICYKGVIYFELMVKDGRAKVIEYNARFGDPEAQAVLPLLETDLLEIVNACIDGRLTADMVKFSDKAAAIVMCASKGYPGAYEKGFEITGIAEAEAEGCAVLHSGTAFKDGRLVTDGGRVLGVRAVKENLRVAVETAYRGVRRVGFNGAFYRGDIGGTP